MRTRVLRVLAGFLAPAFAGLLLFGDPQPPRQILGTAVMATVFGVFALFGTVPAERLLGDLFGVGPPKPGP